ncbi:hypothetical protein B2H97_09860 [Paraclostridium bifermentans]|uniref:hypothetical protein n=1 Tax=Paraclostridium bifermentans TaxID=1490 RepID=UPI000A16EC67|nr:hypothetical protein [Paraclostridium bifermentans]OSB10258.1 hypothetical protein B2H97_09860 [Paraclostridium bifermentans]
MYRVVLKRINTDYLNENMIFDCQYIDFDSSKYRFENIVMNNFVIKDFEVNNEDIELIKIM